MHASSYTHYTTQTMAMRHSSDGSLVGLTPLHPSARLYAVVCVSHGSLDITTPTLLPLCQQLCWDWREVGFLTAYQIWRGQCGSFWFNGLSLLGQQPRTVWSGHTLHNTCRVLRVEIRGCFVPVQGYGVCRTDFVSYSAKHVLHIRWYGGQTYRYQDRKIASS